MKITPPKMSKRKAWLDKMKKNPHGYTGEDLRIYELRIRCAEDWANERLPDITTQEKHAMYDQFISEQERDVSRENPFKRSVQITPEIRKAALNTYGKPDLPDLEEYRKQFPNDEI